MTDTAHPGGQGIEKTGEVKCLGQISQAMISSSSPLRDRHMEASFFSQYYLSVGLLPYFRYTQSKAMYLFTENKIPRTVTSKMQR